MMPCMLTSGPDSWASRSCCTAAICLGQLEIAQEKGLRVGGARITLRKGRQGAAAQRLDLRGEVIESGKRLAQLEVRP